jgi:hypothetical protein
VLGTEIATKGLMENNGNIKCFVVNSWSTGVLMEVLFLWATI